LTGNGLLVSAPEAGAAAVGVNDVPASLPPPPHPPRLATSIATTAALDSALIDCSFVVFLFCGALRPRNA
jgi:hypothetical protein